MGMLHKMMAASRKYTAAGGGAPAYKSAGSLAFVSGSTTVTTPFPTSVSSNDVAILVIYGGNYPSSWPSGFTQLGSFVNSNCGLYFNLAWKRCSGSEGGTSVNSTMVGTSIRWSQIFLFSGCVASGAPHEGAAFATSSITTSVSNPYFTTSGSDRLGVHIFAAFETAAASGTSSPAAGWTENSDTDSNDGSYSGQIVVETRTIAMAGGVSAATSTLTRSRYPSMTSFGLIGT